MEKITDPLDNATTLELTSASVTSQLMTTVIQVMWILIRASKTDPFRKEIKIFVGRTEDDICLISAMLAYLAI